MLFCHVDKEREIEYMLCMDREKLIRVYDQVQRCMISLVGGSGHLASYSLLPDSFKVTEEEKTEHGTKYHFTAKAYRESEFTVYDENNPQKPDSISGSIVLDDSFNPVRDKSGKIMLEPWDCVQIPMQKQPETLRDKVKKQLADKLQAAESIIGKICNECQLKEDDKISVVLEDIQARLKGEKVSVDALLMHSYLEDIYVNMIVGIMDQDMLSSQDEIALLLRSIKKRIDNFEIYFERLEKNELKRPFEP